MGWSPVRVVAFSDANSSAWPRPSSFRYDPNGHRGAGRTAFLCRTTLSGGRGQTDLEIHAGYSPSGQQDK